MSISALFSLNCSCLNVLFGRGGRLLHCGKKSQPVAKKHGDHVIKRGNKIRVYITHSKKLNVRRFVKLFYCTLCQSKSLTCIFSKCL